MAKNPKMLSTREVAQLLGAAESSVRMWCLRGTFPNAKLIDAPRGAVWSIPDSDLKGFVKRERGRPRRSDGSTNRVATDTEGLE